MEKVYDKIRLDIQSSSISDKNKLIDVLEKNNLIISHINKQYIYWDNFSWYIEKTFFYKDIDIKHTISVTIEEECIVNDKNCNILSHYLTSLIELKRLPNGINEYSSEKIYFSISNK